MNAKQTVLSFALLLFGLAYVNDSLYAQKSEHSTTVVVRALAKDAKFIGTSMGGALITITDASTGELLAKGLTEGTTGDTDKLVRKPKERHMQLSTPGTAKFETTLSLKEPLLVTVTATAPMAQAQAQVSSSTQLWLIPGKDIAGDGIILEVPGFAVDVLQPRVHQSISGNQIPIRANIVMMCGCPTSEGGLWDSSEYEVKALIKKEGKVVDQVPLEYAGETSLYEAGFAPKKSGTFEIVVYAYHAKTGNTGVDKTTVIVTQ